MYGLYWGRPAEPAGEGPSRLPAALPHCLALSVLVHGLAAVLVLWLGLPFRPADDRWVIRDVDFFAGADGGAGAGGGGGPGEARRDRQARPPPAGARVPAARTTGAPAAAESPAPELDLPEPKAIPAPKVATAAPVDADVSRDRLRAQAWDTAAPGTLPGTPAPGAGEADPAAGGGTGSGSGPWAGPGRGPGGAAGLDTGDPDFRRYFGIIKDRVYGAWRYPPGITGTYRLSLSFVLQRDGAAHSVRVISSTNHALDRSALAAIQRAAPFPPIPEKFRQLAGEPLTMLFTVTVR
jgi:TonB family protein